MFKYNEQLNLEATLQCHCQTTRDDDKTLFSFVRDTFSLRGFSWKELDNKQKWRPNGIENYTSVILLYISHTACNKQTN